MHSLRPVLVATMESNELKAAISHVYSLIYSCCPTLVVPTLFHPHSLFHPRSSLSAGLYLGLSVCLTVLTVLTIAAVLSIVLSVLSIVLSVLTNVLIVLGRCKPSIPMSNQVLKSLFLQPFSQFLL